MAKKQEAPVMSIDAAAREYENIKIRMKDGILTSRGNGDAVHRALALHKSEGGTLEQVVKANKFDHDPNAYTNNGQFAMAVTSTLRAKINAGEPVKIGKLEIKSLKTPVSIPKFEPATPGGGTGGAKKAKAKAAKPAAKAKSSRKPRAAKAAAVENYDAP